MKHGFKVLLHQEHHLNEHDARELHRYKMNEVGYDLVRGPTAAWMCHSAIQEGYEEHIQRMITGPSVVLLLQKTESKESSVNDFRDLIHGNEEWKAMIDCTQSSENAQQWVVLFTDGEREITYFVSFSLDDHRELILLFPNIAQKPHSPPEKPMERTLAVIRPHALKLHKGSEAKVCRADAETPRLIL